MRLKTLLIVILSLCALPTYAQYRASIQGVVTDPQGGVVSGATLTLTNLDTNQKLISTSNESGIYKLQRPSSRQVFPHRRKDRLQEEGPRECGCHPGTSERLEY